MKLFANCQWSVTELIHLNHWIELHFYRKYISSAATGSTLNFLPSSVLSTILLFPYLEIEQEVVLENEVNLYKYVFPPFLKKATLAVIGNIQLLIRLWFQNIEVWTCKFEPLLYCTLCITFEMLTSKRVYYWNGSLNELKSYIEDNLCWKGVWKSPGGDVKQFVNTKYSFKWVNVS